MEEKKDIIDLKRIIQILWSKKKSFVKVWIVTFVLACVWIFPQPRFYTAEVSLAPEAMGENVGGLAGIASSFGFNLDGASNDAFYPTLYPDLLESNDFIAGLMTVQIETIPSDDDEEPIRTDYYSYLKKHQKKNPLAVPFNWVKRKVQELFSKPAGAPITAKELNPFRLSKKDTDLFEKVRNMISCDVDKKTDVITITVKDQDALVCASMADSVRQHLQDFIIQYRTKKVRMDVEHYAALSANANQEYLLAVEEYASYCDSHGNVVQQSFKSERERLENEMSMRYTTYQTLTAQLEAMKVKLQEKTPAFTVLKSSTVPVKPAGPKRLIFVIGMLMIVSLLAAFWYVKGELFQSETV